MMCDFKCPFLLFDLIEQVWFSCEIFIKYHPFPARFSDNKFSEKFKVDFIFQGCSSLKSQV